MGAKNHQQQLQRDSAIKATATVEPTPQIEPLHLPPTALPEQKNWTDQQLDDALQALRSLTQQPPKQDCKACVFEDNTMPYVRVALWIAFVIVVLAMAYYYIKAARHLGLPQPV